MARRNNCHRLPRSHRRRDARGRSRRSLRRIRRRCDARAQARNDARHSARHVRNGGTRTLAAPAHRRSCRADCDRPAPRGRNCCRGGRCVAHRQPFLPLIVLPPARASGAGYAASAPTAASLRIAALVAFICACLPLLAGASLSRSSRRAFSQHSPPTALLHWRAAEIGGQTGDVAGAAQQAAEIAVLLVFSAGGVV